MHAEASAFVGSADSTADGGDESTVAGGVGGSSGSETDSNGSDCVNAETPEISDFRNGRFAPATPLASSAVDENCANAVAAYGMAATAGDSGGIRCLVRTNKAVRPPPPPSKPKGPSTKRSSSSDALQINDRDYENYLFHNNLNV